MQVNSFVRYVLKDGLTCVSKWTGKGWTVQLERKSISHSLHRYTAHLKPGSDELCGLAVLEAEIPLLCAGRGGLSLLKSARGVLTLNTNEIFDTQGW